MYHGVQVQGAWAASAGRMLHGHQQLFAGGDSRSHGLDLWQHTHGLRNPQMPMQTVNVYGWQVQRVWATSVDRRVHGHQQLCSGWYPRRHGADLWQHLPRCRPSHEQSAVEEDSRIQGGQQFNQHLYSMFVDPIVLALTVQLLFSSTCANPTVLLVFASRTTLKHCLPQQYILALLLAMHADACQQQCMTT